MTRKPGSKSFLAKAGFEKERDPVERLGFFIIRLEGEDGILFLRGGSALCYR